MKQEVVSRFRKADATKLLKSNSYDYTQWKKGNRKKRDNERCNYGLPLINELISCRSQRTKQVSFSNKIHNRADQPASYTEQEKHLFSRSCTLLRSRATKNCPILSAVFPYIFLQPPTLQI